MKAIKVVKRFFTGQASFLAKDLKITKTRSPGEMPKMDNSLPFGRYHTDHMLEVAWNLQKGWEKPKIKPYHDFKLSPLTNVFHYGIECFEGMKAYKDKNGKIRLFRPDMNAARMNRSMLSVAMPSYDNNEFINCLKKLVKLEERWVPSQKGFSLYIRPTAIATDNSLGVHPPHNILFYTVCCPVGPYYAEGFKAVKIYCSENAVRAWPGGLGQYKVGGNYAGTLKVQKEAMQFGCSQCLWLTNGNVTEVGAMNLFFLWKNKQGEVELITANLDGTILPGVTRDSALHLARSWNTFKVTERQYKITELVEALNEKRVLECFGTGTAAVISPVSSILYQGKTFDIPLKLGTHGEVADRLWKEITSIQYGDVEHPWSVLVD